MNQENSCDPNGDIDEPAKPEGTMKKLAPVVVCLLAFSCSSLPRMEPIEPGTRFEVSGADVFSPTGSNWYAMSSPYYGVQFAQEYQRDNESLESLLAVTTIHKVQGYGDDSDFLEHIADQRLKSNDTSRFKVLEVENDYTSYKGVACLRYEWSSEDHESRGITSGIETFQYFKTMGFFCRHPANSAIAFQMEVSYRGSERSLPTEVRSMGEEFFDNIVFTDRGLADL